MPATTTTAPLDATVRSVLQMVPGDPQRKLVTSGTHRTATIAETLERVETARRALGIARIADVTGLDVVGLPVFTVSSTNLMGEHAHRLVSIGSGKGITAMHARVSALMELAERCSALQQPTDPVVLGSAAELCRRHRLVDLSWLPALCPGPDDTLSWTTVTELRSGDRALAPSGAVYIRSPDRAPDGRPLRTRQLSTTGLASGNTVAEATLHALYEVIERHAEHLAASSGPGRHVELHDLGDHPDLVDVVDRFERNGLRVVARELPSPTRVPTFIALAADPGVTSCRALSGGFGTHLDPAVAFSRAVGELVQSRAVSFAGSREDLPALELPFGRYDRDAELQQGAPWWSTDGPPLHLASVEDRSTDTILDDLAQVLDGLRLAGAPDVFVADLTRPCIGIPVVRVLVPGLPVEVRA